MQPWRQRRVVAMSGGGGYPLTSPLQVSGLAAWWAARMESGFANNDPVGTITDQSGNSLNLTQATAGKKPLYLTGQKNGKPAFYGDGVDDFVSGGNILNIGTGSIHLFFVAKYDSVASTTVMQAKSLLAPSIGRYAIHQDTVKWVSLLELSGSVVVNAAGGTKDTNWHLFELVVDRTGTGSITLIVDGAVIQATSLISDAADLTNTRRFLLFAYNNGTDTGEALWMNGKIAEVWVWQRVLTADERTQLRALANSIYAIY